MILLIILFGPIAWKIDFYQYKPLFFANYLNKMHNSQFPIFPWRAFIFSGAYIVKYFIQARENNKEKEFANYWLIVGAAFFILGVLIMNYILPENLTSNRAHPFYYTNA